MRLDSHQHFWKYDPEQYAWIDNSMSMLRRDYLPHDLLPELEASRIDGCIAVQAQHSEKETQFLLTLADECPFIRGVVGWVDLCASHVEETLTHFAAYPQLCGVRHIAQSEPDERFLLQKTFLRGISCLKCFGLTYDILVYAHQLPAALELVGRFPDQPFVLDHIAKPLIRTKTMAPWTQHIREMSTHRNVYCKISGLVTEADWAQWSEDNLKPYLDVVFECFGTDRVMFGSDWPVCLVAATYSRVVGVLRDYTDGLSASDKEKIFGLNAARFYGVEGVSGQVPYLSFHA